MNIDVKRAIGTPIARETPVTQTLPIIIGKMPNILFPGFPFPAENKIAKSDFSHSRQPSCKKEDTNEGHRQYRGQSRQKENPFHSIFFIQLHNKLFYILPGRNFACINCFDLFACQISDAASVIYNNRNTVLRDHQRRKPGLQFTIL